MSPRPAAERRGLFQLRDDVTFLNHGSFGACPREVFAVYQELQRELEAEPVDFLSLERSLPGRLAAARARVAGFLGAERDEIVFVPNATTGMNIVARSLALGPGDEVLTTDHEYGAIDRTWTFLCGKSGARYVRRPLPEPLDDPDAAVAAVWAGVTPRTRVLALSHINRCLFADDALQALRANWPLWVGWQILLVFLTYRMAVVLGMFS